MKCLLILWTAALSLSARTQPTEHTLLWKITGNDLERPSWLFGTIHMLCEEDAVLSPNLQKAIRACDEVFLEVDMDDLFEMMGVMGNMRMKGDTTLRDLLSVDDYARVRAYFDARPIALPFTLIETFKPLLAASTLQEGDMPCDKTAILEQVIIGEARRHGKQVQGLETMAYQAGILDSIPYKLQAEQLVAYIDSARTGVAGINLIRDLFDAYRSQDLSRLEALTVETDPALLSFTDIMLYHRNQNWVRKLKTLLPQRSLVIAVGAGHLPGEKGLIELLRRAGYTVTPEKNSISAVREI
jgi:uncharacterized protein YbaP (TraB family)